MRVLAGTSLTAVLVGLLAAAGSAAAQGPVALPATFWGTVAIGGSPVPAGTEVRGFVDGQDCTQLGEGYRPVAVEAGVSTFAIEVVHESQRRGCGAAGRTVHFTVGGQPAAEPAPWTAGLTRIDLTVGGGLPLALPSATDVVPSTSVERTATAQAARSQVPAAGTPPLDDINPRDVLGRQPTASAESPANGKGGGSAAIIPLALAGVGLIAAGAVGGWILARRGRGSHG